MKIASTKRDTTTMAAVKRRIAINKKEVARIQSMISQDELWLRELETYSVEWHEHGEPLVGGQPVAMTERTVDDGR